MKSSMQTHFVIEGCDKHERLCQQLGDSLSVGGDPHDAVVCKGVCSVAKKARRMQQGGNEHGLEDIQFKVAIGAAHRHGHIVANHLANLQPHVMRQKERAYSCNAHNLPGIAPVQDAGNDTRQPGTHLSSRRNCQRSLCWSRWPKNMQGGSHMPLSLTADASVPCDLGACLSADHGKGLALRGVDFAGHDAAAGLILGQGQLPQATPRPTAQKANVICDLRAPSCHAAHEAQRLRADKRS